MPNPDESPPRFVIRGDLPWIITAIVALVAIVLIAYANWRRVESANARFAHSRVALTEIRKLFSALQDCETGQRGYLLTGEPQYLAPYVAAVKQIPERMIALRETLAGDLADPEDLNRLTSLVDRRIGELASAILIREVQSAEAAVAMTKTGDGRALMDQIRGLIGEMERRVVRISNSQGFEISNAARYAGLMSVAASLILFVLLAAANRQFHRQKEEAIAANKAKSVFLANMSHELRTPLNAIIGYSEMLQEEAEDTGNAALLADLKKVHAAGRHLLSLINSVLDLSKIEAGKMDLYLETFSVRALVDDVVAVTKAIAEKNGNELEVRLDEHAGNIHSDQTKLRQCLLNLLGNAAKFTQHGTIRFHIERDGANQLRFTVQDTGIGMNEAQVKRIFEPFSQGDHSTTRKFGGTGLGLAITNRFVGLLGGTIEVSSQLGKGSTFVLTVPATQQGPAPSPEAPPVPEVSQRATGLVLIVDDDQAVQEILKRHLSKYGLRVESALSGEEGLRLARKLHPNVITLDVLMEGIDGWTVLAAIKADPETADIPVIMMSILDNRNRGYVLGATEYLTKPIDRDRLAGILLRYCQGASVGNALVVEDDADSRALIRHALESEGWRVGEAENGREALDKFKDVRPGIIILDLMMPEMDGFEFVERLRAMPEGKSTPVVVMTAKDVTTADKQRLNGQVAKVLQKGAFETTDLLNEVSRLVVTRLRKTEA